MLLTDAPQSGAMLKRSLTFMILIGLTASAAHSQPSHDCPSSISLARLAASSHIIVVASPVVPVDRVQSAMRESSPEYVEIPLANPSFIKGAANSSGPVIRFWPKVTTYAPSPQTLVDLNGKPSLLFLTQFDDKPASLYLTYSPDSAQSASASLISAIRSEVGRQQAIVERFRPDESLAHFAEVRKLLAALPTATERQEQRIFKQLEALGLDGVPAIVAQMDNRKPLRFKNIDLINYAPDAFEGVRHYGPELIVDALDAILNQVTGFGGGIVNGASERERMQAVAAWRVYAADLHCEPSQ